MDTPNDKLIAGYAEMLQGYTDTFKIELIKRLVAQIAANEEAERDKAFWSSFGGWSDWDKSTEEIIELIRGSRRFRDKDLSF